MSFSKSNMKAAKLFATGTEGSTKTEVSTGRELFYHGNLIAEWRKDGLYISNGDYVPNSGATGSLSTKALLNALPGVSIQQVSKKWHLNGKEWDGLFIKVKGIKPPKTFTTPGEIFVTADKYIRTDGWRGYSEPIYAVAGANDTGMYSDSPCPSNIAESELKNIEYELKKEGIKTKLVTRQTSNVFCVHHYLISKVKDHARAKEIVKAFLETNTTRLAYIA